VADEKEPVERAKEILLYGPIGLALYVRDTAPSFLKVFVARGRAELDHRKRTVGEQLGQARTVGQEKVSPGTSASASAAASAAAAAAPQVLRIVSDGLGKVRETAEGALVALTARGDTEAPADSSADTAATSSSRGVPSAAPESATSEPAEAGPAEAPGLAIPDYDELSASQVVDRLDGLGSGALDAIRAYESAHRGRATILGKIDQLGQTG
jgi:hypothetical protein